MIKQILIVLLSTIIFEIQADVPQKNVKETDKEHKELTKEIMQDIHTHKVMVYSKTYCPYSKKLKKILAGYEINDMKVVELDLAENTREMQDILKTLSGRTTVPQLFINGHFVGGHDETRAIEDKGELRPMLEKAHALSTNRVPIGVDGS
ncbi:unnamed protein product [Caenorhabditis bovis]|uniref:Glutaredoxin domain-containing protein n=1 Tax=Caenorhabditis bovis TaxID=2654633 RepID=A0A8S1ED52_9PELO|nr:unnamed protein product [Caenorhabditis bovis]